MNSEKRYKHIPAKYKKGHCYSNAFTFLMEWRKKSPQLLLCHGWVTGTAKAVKGVRYSHAWLEDPSTKSIIDPSMNVDDPVVIWDFIYYKIGNVDPERVIKYTIEEAILAVAKYRTYGPWDNKYDE